MPKVKKTMTIPREKWAKDMNRESKRYTLSNTFMSNPFTSVYELNTKEQQLDNLISPTKLQKTSLTVYKRLVFVKRQN